MTHEEMMRMTPQQLTELGHIERSKAITSALAKITDLSGLRQRLTTPKHRR